MICGLLRAAASAVSFAREAGGGDGSAGEAPGRGRLVRCSDSDVFRGGSRGRRRARDERS